MSSDAFTATPNEEDNEQILAFLTNDPPPSFAQNSIPIPLTDVYEDVCNAFPQVIDHISKTFCNTLL